MNAKVVRVLIQLEQVINATAQTSIMMMGLMINVNNVKVVVELVKIILNA